jgi:hypothetical protein
LLYRCFIRGENFPGELMGMKGLAGFYTTRWVEATSPEEAEAKALEILRADPDLKVSSPKIRERGDKARVYFEKIDPVRPGIKTGPNKGATWFEMD